MGNPVGNRLLKHRVAVLVQGVELDSARLAIARCEGGSAQPEALGRRGGRGELV